MSKSFSDKPVEVKPGIYAPNWPPVLPTLVDMRMVKNRQFPAYVEYAGSQPIEENLTVVYLRICDEEYRYHPTDKWIDSAIFLASTWEKGEQTFKRIVTLREWLRENEQHGHNLAISALRTLKDCLDFIIRLIRLEHPPEFTDQQEMDGMISEHTQLFTNEK